MLKIDNLLYCKNNKELVNTLFVGPQTGSGFYKKTRKGFKLFNLRNKFIKEISKDEVIK